MNAHAIAGFTLSAAIATVIGGKILAGIVLAGLAVTLWKVATTN